MVDRAYYYKNYDPDNPIAQMNREAAASLDPNQQRRMVEDQKIFGEYNFAPIMEEKKQALKDALNEIHKIVTPTIKGLSHTSNVAEIQDRIYRKIAPWENQFNVCVFDSKTVKDTNYCADTFANQLRGPGVEYTKSVLKDY